MDWHHVKDWMEASSGLDMDALHVYAGVLIQILAAAILRRSLRSPLPWLIVLAAIAANEYYDLHYEVWPERHRQYMESVKDGWKQTKTHHYISQSIPRIEEYFVHAFEKLLSSKDRPIEPTTFELVKFAINHDHIDWSIAIEIRSARSRLG